MAQITITVPDAVVERVLDAFAATYGYSPDAGQTRAQFARQQVAAYIRSVVVSYETEQALANAAATQRAASETDVSGVA